MLLAENDDNSSICEEPKIYYNSTYTNYGVKAYFSERKLMTLNRFMSFNPNSLQTNRFSLCNTIMMPSINTESSLDFEKNNSYNKINNSNNKLSNLNCQTKPSIQIENTRIKTESLKEEKNIIDKNQLKENNQKEIILEKNPFFLGKNLKLNFCQDNINSKNNEENENSSDNEKNEKDVQDFFKKGSLSKSYICSKSKSRCKIKEKEEDEFKSEKKLITKCKRLSIGKAVLDLKKGKIMKNKSHKKKTHFSKDTKNFTKKDYENKKDNEDSLKMKNIKTKIDNKDKNSEKKNKGLFYSNKCNHKNNLIFKKNKLGNNINDDMIKEKNFSDKKIKIYKYNVFKSQRIDSKFNKQKNNNEENKNVNKNRITNKFKSYQPNEGIQLLKEYLKNKEKSEESSDENSFNNKEKRKTLFKKRYNSKNEKELKQLIKKRKNTDEDFKKKINHKKIMQNEKEKVFVNKNKINKCLTIDLSKQKSALIINKNFKQKSTSISSKKKFKNMDMLNIFGNPNNKFKKIDFENVIKKNIQKTQFNLFSQDKFTNTEFNKCDYLKYTLDCMDLILDIDIENQNRLKNKVNFNFPKTKKNKVKKKIALFDLDETLIHCTGDIKLKKEKYQHTIEIKLPGKQAVQVGINIRPYWKQTLNLIKKKYYIVVYTASHQAYADAVLDFMDPQKKYFKYRLYRNNCSLVDVEGAKFYVKDLDIFNEYYDLKDIVIIDNSVLSFAFHLHNGIPIVPYYDEDKDGSLYVVGLYLMYIFKEDDLREANKNQINLDSFLEEAKKNREEYIEEEKIIEETNNEDENNNDNGKEIPKLEKKNTKRSFKKFEKDKILKKSSKLLLTEYTKDTQKKLMSQSRLMNMYYEVKDNSKNNKDTNEEDIFKKENEDKKKIIIFSDDEDIDCKSVPEFFQIDQNNYSDNEYIDEEKQKRILKRMFTKIEEIPIKQIQEKDNNLFIKSNKNNNLKFIRSNFYNRFKI